MIDPPIWEAAIASGLGAAGITWSVVTGRTQGLDAHILARLQPRRPLGPDGKPSRVITFARDLAALGGDTLRLVFLSGCVLALLAVGRPRDAALMGAIFFGARIALHYLKTITRRARPDLFEHGVVTYTTSFPSGHTYMAAVLFLSAALIIPEHAADALRVVAMGFALGVSALIGWTRLMLGIHWPSDVAVGWLAGISWACGWALLA